MRFILSILAFLTLSAVAHAQSDEVVTNRTVGLEITKPAAWQHLTAEANAENLRNVEMTDKALQEAVIKYANAPIIAFTKYPEPYPDLNPSFKVNLRPAGQLAGRNGSEILDLILPTLEKGFAKFVLQEGPTETTVSGLPGAYARINFTMLAGGMEFPTTSELWVVAAGKFLLPDRSGHPSGRGDRHQGRDTVHPRQRKDRPAALIDIESGTAPGLVGTPLTKPSLPANIALRQGSQTLSHLAGKDTLCHSHDLTIIITCLNVAACCDGSEPCR